MDGVDVTEGRWAKESFNPHAMGTGTHNTTVDFVDGSSDCKNGQPFRAFAVDPWLLDQEVPASRAAELAICYLLRQETNQASDASPFF